MCGVIFYHGWLYFTRYCYIITANGPVKGLLTLILKIIVCQKALFTCTKFPSLVQGSIHLHECWHSNVIGINADHETPEDNAQTSVNK